MTWSIVTPGITRYQAIDETSTTQYHPLGFTIQAEDNSTDARGCATFIYLQGVASTAIGSWVAYYPDNWATALLDSAATQKQDVAVSMAANIASTYGWYMVRGKAFAIAADVADNGDVWATATPGTADDATNDGYMVHKARWASADTLATTSADVEICWPYTDGIAGND
jgi:hypothetical protein